MTVNIPARTFTWSQQAGVPRGVAEASDIYQFFKSRKMLTNFYVKSERTGKVLFFDYNTSKLDADGELIADIYTAEEGAYQIWLYND